MFNSPGTYSEDFPWPMFQHGAQNTCLYVLRVCAAFPAFLFIYMFLLMNQSQQMFSFILLAVGVAVAAFAAVIVVFWWRKIVEPSYPSCSSNSHNSFLIF